jgi:hypothetical protein
MPRSNPPLAQAPAAAASAALRDSASEPPLGAFFISRTGVCVYVYVQGKRYRVQFTDPRAHGVVTGPDDSGGERALTLARAALERHRAELGQLFDRLAHRTT